MTSWMIYEKIRELKRKKLNKSQVCRYLGIDYKTVLKYWDMAPDDFSKARSDAGVRKRKADVYKDYVVECLKSYPDMTAAQIYDWILENTGRETLEFKERAFRSYVSDVRKEYNISKPEKTRQYEAVADPPFGKQAQVDMGEIRLETSNGGTKKIYGFAMVLSNSRYKYVLWREDPWTTESIIDAHLKAFTFFGGRPREIVYDQDRVLAVSENHGDIIFTAGFQSFIDVIGFSIYLCRGYDPESKGRVESVIKYAKNGFAAHRIFSDIDTFNEDCVSWLNRTANAKEHDTTKKIPAEVFALEQEYLLPVSEYSFIKPVNKSIPYQVRKDNVVLYKSNRYRVPVGTYKKGKKVYIVQNKGEISIVDSETGEIYAKHPLCTGKGELIGSSTHDYRDMSQSLKDLEKSIVEKFEDDCEVKEFLTNLYKNKQRYYRDQLLIIRKLLTEWDTSLISKAISYCTEREIYSAVELKLATTYLFAHEKDKGKKTEIIKLPEKYRGQGPEIRNLSIYENAMRGGVING